MTSQERWTFIEAFLTVVAGAGAAGIGLTGVTFPGWWTFTVAAIPTLLLATLAGVRRVNSLNTQPKP